MYLVFTFQNGQKETGKQGTENEQAKKAHKRCGGRGGGVKKGVN
jgi:hypothetical protein